MAKIDANHRMFTLNCRGRLLSLQKPLIMGIINATPDSFYSGSRFTGADAILAQAEKMLQDGASIIDIGGQSTRPGSRQVDEDEELRRLEKAIVIMQQRLPEAVISVDTYYSRVAEQTVAAGACIINDIGGGNLDTAMPETVGRLGVPYICMHMKGTPETMHRDAVYENVSVEVLDYLIGKLETCREARIHDVIVDPGFGFSKTIGHNFQLLRELSLFRILERPILVGLSRKSTVYKTLGITAEHALNGSSVLHTLALLNGANILRVHDVKEAAEVVRLMDIYTERDIG